MIRETKFIFGITIASFLVVIMTLIYFQKKYESEQLTSVDNFIQGGDIEKQMLVNERDSLKSELFVKEVQLTRYEVAFEMFKEKNRTGAEEFNLILTTQTE